MNYKLFLLLPFVAVFLACSEEEIEVPAPAEAIIGYWVSPQYADTLYNYSRAAQLKDNDYGFAIQPDGSFIERANAGWCGTPPIAYADYKGTWSYTDSVLDISVGFWGGTVHYKWKLVSVDQNKLSYSKIDVEYQYVDDRFGN